MDNKVKLEAFVASAGKKAKGLIGTAIHAVDQNADGKFDVADVAVVAENVGNVVKKGAQSVKENVGELARIAELKTLQPIFSAHVDNAVALDDADFVLTKLIRVVERPKKYADSEVCKGSIGHLSTHDGFRVVTIFDDSLDKFGLSFTPDRDQELYYVDPTDRDHYIALDEYFSYMKQARIAELRKIAQDLGATDFKVTYREEKTSFQSKKVNANAKISSIAAASAEHSESANRYTYVNVEAGSKFTAHPPIMPQLKYLQHDSVIQNLIALRMDKASELVSDSYIIEMSNSCGIKKRDAEKIDGVLKGLKYSGNATVANEVMNESRKTLEYKIEF